MILDLLHHWPVDKNRSFLIGNMPSDIQAADAAHVPGFLYEGGDLRDFAARLIDRRETGL
jgi:D-glycero-D-manno-heptose 1,7-bisphosphate phosphatase